ncbi:MAG: hypothetical protein JSS61_03520 [Verrucomicrobia bacterium]|nr:hypothetical protein [Verrucomicrobiota bacterium]
MFLRRKRTNSVVKPGNAGLAKIRDETLLPVCAYHVSGEYAMIMTAHEAKLLLPHL